MVAVLGDGRVELMTDDAGRDDALTVRCTSQVLLTADEGWS